MDVIKIVIAECNYVLKSYLSFQIELALRARSALVSFHEIALLSVQLHLIFL